MTDAFVWCHREDMDIRQVDVFDGSEVWAAYVERTHGRRHVVVVPCWTTSPSAGALRSVTWNLRRSR